jgi:predicted RNA-binding Zn-ribbon protein involved in translation (DUF1610 family)
MEAVEMDPGREFECPNCESISIHRAKPGAKIDVWCPSCRKTTEYRVRGDGVVEAIG